MMAHSQSGGKVSGLVSDSTGHGIRSASVVLSGTHDTLKTATDSAGHFSFSAVRTGKFTLSVSIMGYHGYTGSYTLKEEYLQLKPVILKGDVRVLKEVQVKGEIKAVTVKKDTIEYNAAAYHVLPDDRVSELIKQLPGVMVDANGNVTSMGKTLTKIRVNGKDFFTGNVKEFIAQLPADLVNKIQIIDDYGDQAAYTGVKTGTPTKMLNLVTKKGQNSGKFGNATLNLGTNHQYGLGEQANLWQDMRQISLNSGITTADNGAGKATGQNGSLSYRDNLGKDNVFGVLYIYGHNSTASLEQSYTETVTDAGSIFANSENTIHQSSNKQQLNINFQHKGETDFVNAILSASFQKGGNESVSQMSQSGLILQDQTTGSDQANHNPDAGAVMQYTHRFEKPGRSLTVNLNGSINPVNTENYQDNRIQYYDPSTSALQKDSLLNLLSNSRNHTSQLNTLVAYNEPLGKPKEGISRSLNLSYSNTISSVRNSLQNSAQNPAGNYVTVDSLSSSYRTLFISQRFDGSYIYTGNQLDYTFGASALPNNLDGSYIGRPEHISTNSFNVLPIFNINYHPKEGRSLTLAYSGNSVLPEFSQLQPLPDTRNLQDVTIGNPDLKPSVAHSGTLGYNRTTESGNVLQLSANASTVQNKVVSNTILIPDTLNSLKQQTRYLNTSGNYAWGGNYSWSMPFAKNRYNIEVLGNLGYSKDTYYANGQPGTTSGLNYSQGINLRAGGKSMEINAGGSYSYSANRYSLGTLNPGNLRTWSFTSNARFVVAKIFRAGLQVNKMINEGYAFSQANPLIVNLEGEALLFKRKQGSIKLQAFDLLDQGDNQQRTVSGNVITDSRTNQLRRYFQATFTYRLEKFGKRTAAGLLVPTR